MNDFELMRGLVAIDTETGGAGETECMTHALLSIGAYARYGFMTEFRFHQLIFPRQGLIVTAEAMEVNGYSRVKWLQGGAVEEDVGVIRFFSWLSMLKGALCLSSGEKLTAVAHNAGHDRGFLSAAFGRYGLLQELEKSVLSRRWRCSCAALGLAQDAGLVPGVHGASLDALTALRTGMPIEEVRAERGLHAADGDARLCWEGYGWLIGMTKCEGKNPKVEQEETEGTEEGGRP